VNVFDIVIDKRIILANSDYDYLHKFKNTISDSWKYLSVNFKDYKDDE
jgi:hypothetical protein